MHYFSSEITFSKTLTVGGDTETELDGITIFTGGSGVSMTFTCKYNSEATATSTAIDIEAGMGQITGLTEVDGKLDDGLTLTYHDDTYTTERTTSIMGATLYPKINWKVTTLVGKVGFYIKSCDVEDVSVGAASAIHIISKSCYAKVVTAKPAGNKFVDRDAMFEYTSFSYNTKVADSQRLVCEVEFCLLTDNGP